MEKQAIIFPRELRNIGDCLTTMTKEYKGKYKTVNYCGERWPAARLSYCLNVEKIPRLPRNRKDGLLLHHCDNAWCCNPEHLYIGTQKQNMKDLFSRNKEFREKVGSWNKGRAKTPEERLAISKRMLGNNFSKGNILSEETRKKMSEARMGNTNASKKVRK